MRLLQINPNGSEASALDFHPMLTVVQGLGPAGRDLLVEVMEGLPRGTVPSVGGLLEAHGVLLDLSPEMVSLLDLTTDVEVVVRRDALPGAGASAAVVGEAGGGRASRAEIERFIEETPKGVHPDLDKARRGRADAAAALAVLREALETSNAKYEPVLAEKRRVEAALEMARRAAARAEDEASRAEAAESEEARLAQVRARRTELRREIDDLAGRAKAIEQGLAELSSIDTRPLTVLLEAIHNPEPVEYVPSERAAELADEFVALTKRVAELERQLGAEGLDSGTAMRRLEECRQELAVAEKAMRKPELTDLDVAELEAAHELVVEAELKASGLRKKAGEKAFEEAKQREQEILDRIGFPTWTAYVMGASLMGIDPIAEQRLEQAQAAMDQAEQHWARVVEVIETNPEYRDLLNRLEEVYLEAYDLLGGEEPEDIETALRELQVPKREVTTEELADALAYQLELVGLDLGPGPSVDLTVMAAEAFLEEAQAVEGRIAELRDEQGQVAAALTVAEAELGELPDLPDEPEPGDTDPWLAGPVVDDVLTPSDTASLSTGDAAGSDFFESFLGDDGDEADDQADDDGRDALNAFLAGPDGRDTAAGGADAAYDGEPAGAADAVHDGPIDDDRIVQLEQELEAATEEELEYREWVESREALVDAALQVETVATSRLMKIAGELIGDVSGGEPPAQEATTTAADAEAIEHYVLGRLTSLRDVSYAGSVPLLLDDALTGLDEAEIDRLLDKVDGLADAVQVIYVSDDQRVAAWAERVGFARAAVVQAPAGFGL